MDDEKLDIDIIDVDEEVSSDQSTVDSTQKETQSTAQTNEKVSSAEDLNEELVVETKEPEKMQISKDELLEKTYNLSEDLQNVDEKQEEEEDDKSVVIFIAFIFAFLALFILALPLISRIFE